VKRLVAKTENPTPATDSMRCEKFTPRWNPARTTAHRMAAYRKLDRRRVDTRFSLLKYCSRSEPSLENCGSPTLRFGEVLDFSLSFCLRHPAAWPAAFQITIKNNAESSLFEPLRDVFSKNFQSSMPFVWFLMFISFHQCGITGCIKFPLYGMRRLYVNMAQVNQFHDDIFSV